MRFRNANVFKHDVSVTFIGSLLTAALGLVSAVIVARALGPAGRGLLALALFIPAIVATFCRFGQDTVNSVFAGLYKDRRAHLFQQSILVTLCSAVIGWIVVSAYFFWLPIPRGEFADIPANMIRLSVFVVPVSVLQALMITLVRGTGRITAAAILGVVHRGCLLAAVAVLLGWFGRGIETALLIMVCAPLVPSLLAMWVVRKEVSLRPSAFSRETFWKALRMGALVSLATVAGFLIYRLDQGMLAYMVSAEEVGVYVIAVGLAERLKMLPGSVATAFLPRLANELGTRQAQVPAVFRATVVLSGIAMLGAGLLGIPIIYFVFGAEYRGAIPSFLILLPGVAALGGASILASDILAREKPKYSVWVGYTMLGLNVVLNLALIPLIGIAGAATASTLCYGGACGMRMVYYRRESGVAIRELIPRWGDVRFVWTNGLGYARQVLGQLRQRKGGGKSQDG